jgi:hypothetical protein
MFVYNGWMAIYTFFNLKVNFFVIYDIIYNLFVNILILFRFDSSQLFSKFILGLSIIFFCSNIGNFSSDLSYSLLAWLNLMWFRELLDQSLNKNFITICSTNFVYCSSHCLFSYRAFKMSSRYLLDFMEWGFNGPLFFL